MQLSKWWFFGLILLTVQKSYAQLEAAELRSEAYYIFPIKPGEQNTLSGTMGELRSTHFHSGIDVRTEGRTGLPVYAAASGYISRVVVSASGYGNTLYIKHPNGHTTVYAHLQEFMGAIKDYVLKEHYRQEQFELDLSLHKDQFNVNKGDKIALSGNSGSSQGPHLHFDIRDQHQRPLNPLSYGFNEILDRTPPVAEKLIIKPLNMYSRVNGQFSQKEYRLRRIGNNYILDQPIRALGEVGIMLDAHDKLDYSRFRCGINTISLEVNGEKVYQQQIDRVDFGEMKEIYQHMSFEDSRTKGEYFNKLYIDDGNELDFYQTNHQKGKLNIAKGQEYTSKITMIDSYGNSSMVTFTIIGESVPLNYFASKDFDTEVIDNVLVITNLSNSPGSNIILNGEEKSPSFTVSNGSIYLHDLRKELPKVIEVDGKYIPFAYKETIFPNRTYSYYSNELDIYFQRKSLFDTLFLETNYYYDSADNSEIWSIGKSTSPLRKPIKIELKPKLKYDKSKYAAYAVSGNYKSYKRGHWERDQYHFWTSTFGKFTLLTDTIAPSIRPIRVNSTSLQFRISDDLSGIKSFNCYVNGDWVLMHYDYKRRTIWSERLDKNKPLSGTVTLRVVDECNNENIFKTQLN